MTNKEEADILLNVLNTTIGTGLTNETLLIWEILQRAEISLEDAELIAPIDIIPIDDEFVDDFEINPDEPRFYDPEFEDEDI